MAEGGDAEDKTEAASPRRLEKAREEGNVPLSREAVMFASLAGATLVATVVLPSLGRQMLLELRDLVEGAQLADPQVVMPRLVRIGLMVAAPIAAGAALAATGATLLQTGFLLRAEALMPDLSRINPLAGLKRLLGMDSLVELLRTLLKIGAVGAALYSTIELAPLLAALQQPAGTLLAEAGRQAQRMMVAALVAFLLVGAADVFWVRHRHASKLRMSRQDLKEELRESDGDPMVKARLRQLRMQRARRRALAAVPKAAVVVTNPTHYAIALAYEVGQSAAPRIVAKGVDSLALRIREVAKEHGVPIVENPPLARALYPLPDDSEVPPEHWQAVAEVISFVLRLGRRG